MSKEKEYVVLVFGPDMEAIAELHEVNEDHLIVSKVHIIIVQQHPQTKQIGFQWQPAARFMDDPLNKKIPIKKSDYMFKYTPNKHIIGYFEDFIQDTRARIAGLVTKKKGPTIISPNKMRKQ